MKNCHDINRFRYESGIDYEFNLIHQLNVFFMYQQNLEESLNDVVFGVGYTYNFKLNVQDEINSFIRLNLRILFLKFVKM
jgi:hypothetical protein